MGKDNEVFVGLDVAKMRHAVAVAEEGRDGEVRYLGEIGADTESVRRLVAKLEKRHRRLHFCYEAGPTGCGLYRQLTALGHGCTVVAPSLIPRRPGDRVKTNRRDAEQLARLLRAGELTAVWVPDEAHEAMRDLVRSRQVAVDDVRRKRQAVSSMMLRNGRTYPRQEVLECSSCSVASGATFRPTCPASRAAGVASCHQACGRTTGKDRGGHHRAATAMVACRRCRSVASVTWRQHDHRGHGDGGSRRPPPVRHPARTDGLYRAGAGRTVSLRRRPACGAESWL